MPRGRTLLLLGLHAVGLAIALYLTWLYDLSHYLVGGEATLCTWGKWFDCHAVIRSRWAEIAPGWPISAAAVAYFTFQILWTATEGRAISRTRPDVPLLLNLAACLTGLIWLGAMVLSVRALCPFCLGIDLVLWVSLAVRWLSRPAVADGAADLGGARTALLAAGVAAAVAGPRWLGTAQAHALMRKDAAEILAQAPRQELAGAPSGPPTLVAFIDFGCPICRRGSRTLRELARESPDAFRLVLRHFPINPDCNPSVPKTNRSEEHRFACEAARLALAAEAEGRLEEVYTTLYDHQESQGAEVARLARDPALSTRLAAGDPERRLADDVALGLRIKLEGVPTYFLDGYEIEGPRDLDEWKMLLDSVRSKRRTP